MPYNSAKSQVKDGPQFRTNIELPHKVFYNDMSKDYMRDEFKSCDVIYSEPAWSHGYKKFNERAGNRPDEFDAYISNINKLIEELEVPSFIVNSKTLASRFPKAKQFPIWFNTTEGLGDATVFVWNFDEYESLNVRTTLELLDILSKRFGKCLDFSCGYGEHLMKFKDFVACDINRNCLTYLSILIQERNRNV